MADTGKTDSRKSGSKPEQGTKQRSDSDAGNPFGLPDFNFEEMLERFKIPGVDAAALFEAERRNFEALQEAGAAMNEGWQALATQQREIFERAVQRWQETLTAGMPDSASKALEQQTEMTREVVQEALANMQKLTETAAGAQAKAFEVIRKRFEERMKELSGNSTDR